MSYDAAPLVSQRMKNLAACALGGCVGASTTAIGTTASDLSSDSTPVMYLGTGALSAGVQATNIDLSDVAICEEAGQVVPAGETMYFVILQDGTNVLARLCSSRKVTSRASVTAALVETISHDVVPADIDMETYVITGWAKLVNVTNPFIVGTTLLSATGVTDTFGDLSNAMPGSILAF